MNEKNKWDHLKKYCISNENTEFVSNYSTHKLNTKKQNRYIRLIKLLIIKANYILKKIRRKFPIYREKFNKFAEKIIVSLSIVYLVIALFVWAGSKIGNSNSTKMNSVYASTDTSLSENNIQKMEISFTENNMAKACSEDELACEISLWERVVSIQHYGGLGTGFIIEGDKDFLTIVTASHVIRKGNGHKSTIHDSILVMDHDSNLIEKPISACAFFTKGYADIGLVKIKNNTNIIFEKIESFDFAKQYEKVTVIDYRDENKKRSWVYTVNGFIKNENLVSLYGVAQPGMSGSPILKKDGSLLGVLISGNEYYTFGTYKFNEIIHFGIDYLVSQQNYFAPYICKEF